MPRPKTGQIPAGLTEEARNERRRFEARYQEFLEKAGKIALSVLVWGSSPESDSLVASKRKQIRAELIKLGHNAMFSEEFRTQDEISEKSKEFSQAQAAHSIIILPEDAPGALAEAHDFCDHPEIAPKVLVMMPTRYKEGYSAKGAIQDLEEGHGGVYWYNDADLEACSVLDRAVKRVEARRYMQLRYQDNLAF